MPPKLKLLGLNQIFGNPSGHGQIYDSNNAALYSTSNQNITPSNLSSNGSNSHAFMAKSHLNIHGGTHLSGSIKKQEGEGYQRSSGSRRRKRSGGARDRSAESRTSRRRTKSGGGLSTGRGASSGSGGRGMITNPVPIAPMVMTERNSVRPVCQAPGGKFSQDRHRHHSKNSKSFTKGGSALSKPSL